MTHRIGSKGQVVIPKELREQAGLHPGAEVDFALEEGRVVLSRRRASSSSLRGRFRGSAMTERLLEDRRREPR